MSPLTFLVHHTVQRPGGIDAETWAAALAQERAVAAGLVDRKVITDMWRVPGCAANWAVWTVDSPEELHEVLMSLPLAASSSFEVHLLAEHPIMKSENR